MISQYMCIYIWIYTWILVCFLFTIMCARTRVHKRTTKHKNVWRQKIYLRRCFRSRKKTSNFEQIDCCLGWVTFALHFRPVKGKSWPPICKLFCSFKRRLMGGQNLLSEVNYRFKHFLFLFKCRHAVDFNLFRGIVWFSKTSRKSHMC